MNLIEFDVLERVPYEEHDICLTSLQAPTLPRVGDILVAHVDGYVERLLVQEVELLFNYSTDKLHEYNVFVRKLK